MERRLRDFLLEDIGFGDITSDAIIQEDLTASAEIVFKEDAVLAGLEEASAIFNTLGCETKSPFRDGVIVKEGTVVLSIEGNARAILRGERVALNILMRMSGISTATHKAVTTARDINPSVRIAATRKTCPGFRFFEKQAVSVGGGDTHRFRLEDSVLIKNNHLKLISSIREAVKMAKESVSFTKKIEVEVENISQAIEAVEAGVDIVMLDNMKPKEILLALEELKKLGLRDKVLVEASGGVNLDNLSHYAETGVDIISLGALTHSVKAINVSLRIVD